MIVPVIESDQQAQDAATDVADVVSGTHRHATDFTRYELFGDRVTDPQINTHLSRTLKIVLPLVGMGMPVKFTHGARLDLQHGEGQCGRDRKLVRGNPPLRAAARNLETIGPDASDYAKTAARVSISNRDGQGSLPATKRTCPSSVGADISPAALGPRCGLPRAPSTLRRSCIASRADWNSFPN
jgi:hypothetical protein